MEKETAIASLIHWSPNVPKERIERWLEKLKEEGHIISETTQEYETKWGCPVWYIP